MFFVTQDMTLSQGGNINLIGRVPSVSETRRQVVVTDARR